MAQTIRITITPDLKKALQILHQSTLGTLNTSELIKLAVGSFAKLKAQANQDLTAAELDQISAKLFFDWAKEDSSLEVDNIVHPEKLKPYTPKKYV